MAVPEMVGDYEILQSIRLGGSMMLLGYNPRDKETPYMTCYQQYNLLGEKIFPQAVAGDNYVEILQIFLDRLQEQQKAVAEFREKRGVPIEVLGAEHCRERGEKESLEGKLVILRPTSLAAEYRTADCQLRTPGVTAPRSRNSGGWNPPMRKRCWNPSATALRWSENPASLSWNRSVP